MGVTAALTGPVVNSDPDLEAGLLFIPLDAKMSSAQEKIFLSVRFGEDVSVK